MEELARIEAKLQSLSELEELVGALRSMAASRAREAQAAFTGTRSYRETVEGAIAVIAPLVPSRPAPGAGEHMLIVVTSENGFVGGFNNRLVERAARLRQEGERLILVGRRGQVAAAERGMEPDRVFGMTSRAGGVTALARRIAAGVKGAGAVRLLYAGHRPGAAFEIEEKPVLPLDEARQKGAVPPVPPLFQLPPETLLERLSWEYLFAEIAAALMESLASENGARLRTMDAAARNIEDRLEKLRREEQMARQEETTADMLDVVIGAEAVNHG